MWRLTKSRTVQPSRCWLRGTNARTIFTDGRPAPPLRPTPIKERLSVLYIERGPLHVLDGAFVVVDVTGVRTHIPVGVVPVTMPGYDLPIWHR